MLEGHTHPQKLQSLESLARYDCDELHFAQKSNLGRRQPRWKRQCHVATRYLHLGLSFKPSEDAPRQVAGLGLASSGTSTCHVLSPIIFHLAKTPLLLSRQRPPMPSLTQVWLLPGAVILIVCLAANWVERVSGLVPEPYLVSLQAGMILGY